MNAAGRRPSAWTPRTLTLLAALVGVLFTLLIVAVPGLRFAYHSVQWHVILETFDLCAAGAIALLFLGRYSRSRSATDLGMTVSFFVLTLVGIYTVSLPEDAAGGAIATVWFPLAVRLVAAGAIVLAAVSPPDRVHGPRQARWVLVTVGVAFAALAIAAGTVRSHVPLPVDATVDPGTSGRPRLTGSAVVLAAQLVHALLYAVAAVAFTRRAERTSDRMLSWLAAGCAIAATARVNYALFPSLYSQWLYSGDVLRTLFYLLLVIGGVNEVTSYWAAQAETAVFAERRRLARDLHDGTVQELGYIRVLAHGLRSNHRESRDAERIAAAADRALAEARQAIHALSMPLDQPFSELLRTVATEVGDRYDLDVQVTAKDVHVPDYTTRAALVRIVREAVTNAARHADASSVEIHVADGTVEVSDNGTGFDPSRRNGGGFGITSMQDRAEAIGGRVSIVPRSGGGTTVKVSWNGAH